MPTPTFRFFAPRRAALAAALLVFSFGALRAEDAARPSTPPSVLKKYDKNKDGLLDEQETAKWEADKAQRREKDRQAREERLQKYDTDHDGKLSDDEKAAAKLAMDSERAERDMAKGKEKAEARLAREKETKDKLTPPAEPKSEKPEKTEKPDKAEKTEDGMMTP